MLPIFRDRLDLGDDGLFRLGRRKERLEALWVLSVGEELGQPEGRVCRGQVDHAEVDEEGRDDVVGEDGEVVRARYRNRGGVGLPEAEGDGVQCEQCLLEAVDRWK